MQNDLFTTMRLIIILASGVFFSACCPPEATSIPKQPQASETAIPSPASSPQVTRPHRFYDEGNADPKEFGDSFEWNRRSPVEFLELLKERAREEREVLGYIVVGIHHDWVQDSDVEALMERLDSEIPCASVEMVISSVSLGGLSTEGHEAGYLLEGYRQRFYPHELSSLNRFTLNKELLRQWFRGWRTRK